MSGDGDEGIYQYPLRISESRREEWMEHVGPGKEYTNFKSLIVQSVDAEIDEETTPVPDDLDERTADGGHVDLEPILNRLDALDAELGEIRSTLSEVQNSVVTQQHELDNKVRNEITGLVIEKNQEVDIGTVAGWHVDHEKDYLLKTVIERVQQKYGTPEMDIRRSVDRLANRPDNNVEKFATEDEKPTEFVVRLIRKDVEEAPILESRE